MFKSFFSPLVRLNIKQMTRAAVIAALYSVITILAAPLSYGPIQLRFAEAFTILPALLPEAVIGVTIGCLISNVFTGMWTDMVFGTLATLIAAFLTYLIGCRLKKHICLAAVPPVLVNALIVPLIIFAYIGGDLESIGIAVSAPFLIYLSGFLSLAIGQSLAVYGLGLPLYAGVKAYLKATGGKDGAQSDNGQWSVVSGQSADDSKGQGTSDGGQAKDSGQWSMVSGQLKECHSSVSEESPPPKDDGGSSAL
ncbi:hypothetical protein FACS1894211_03500 [Clostridia bacterium]|nr:hypothetical protein FACS1894211_03500 [Clostridia bacterium]